MKTQICRDMKQNEGRTIIHHICQHKTTESISFCHWLRKAQPMLAPLATLLHVLC